MVFDSCRYYVHRKNTIATLKEPYRHPKDDEKGSRRGAKPIDILCGDIQYDLNNLLFGKES